MTIAVALSGPLTVTAEGAPLRVKGAIPSAILARLALSAGEYVDTDTLIGDVWVDAPEKALTSLRAHISRLRDLHPALGSALQGSRRGYLLDLARDRVDVLRFRDGVGALDQWGVRGDSDARLRVLVELEAMTDGEPLAGLDAFPFVAPVRAALRSERRMVLEELAEQRLERGENALAIALLADLVEQHPTHERPVRLLAVALARVGRTTDATETVDSFERRLAALDGIPLSGRMRDLRQAILRRDPEIVQGGGANAATVKRTGVPIPLTRFIGRRAEVQSVQALRRKHRVITIVGPGGVGKTRLAVEIARSATTADDDDQWMVDLAPVPVEGVLGEIAVVVGAREAGIEAVLRRVTGRRGLLILDNADLLIGAVSAIVDELSARAPELTILTTSRESLRLPHERVVVVGPMLGDDAADALRIFEQRAADATGATLGDSGLEAASQLCDLLDGIPLALEIAAARLDVYSVEEVRDAVARHVRLDGGGGGRHASVEAAVEWSLTLVTAPQRDLLAGLARFVGPFTPTAVEGVLGTSPDATDRLIQDLVEKSLVAVVRGDAGERSWRLLESVKSVARRIPAADDVLRLAHRDWFARFAREVAPTLRTFDAARGRALFDLHRADLDTALGRAIDDGDREAALSIAGSQANHWFARGMLVDGRATIERALAVEGTAAPQTEADALLGACILAYQGGDAAAAFDYIGAAGAKGLEAGDAAVPLVALAQEAYGRSLFGAVHAADALLEEADALLPAAPDWAKSEYHMCRGQMLRAAGDLGGALDALTEAHRISASIGYAWIVASSLYVTGKVLVDARRPRRAIAVLRSGFDGCIGSDQQTSALALLHVIAGACAFVERHEEGAALFGAIDRMGVRHDYNPVIAEGDDAKKRRDAVAAGLTGEEFDRAYRSGGRMGVNEVRAVIAALPQETS
ncbi:BTAD domain-containing putative transcriptional regulator [Herbiconiux sp. L3-i23]|uniref:BTAD domain-containing putative transcriptional regulator n=1 Tax=Herbiconiux sp. L3-i23 TaxID=2905871 RepID=UPI00206D8B96|nr:BTAD domain-containing putative transcriptional regulator [Herbiconiux sp. L3-i23]BDI22584.1 SARP family transcriptional regulator [Herbiconiux sp. L3-i23]